MCVPSSVVPPCLLAGDERGFVVSPTSGDVSNSLVVSVQSSLQVSSKLVERAAQTFSSSVQETGICR